jgi:hypothetical protein
MGSMSRKPNGFERSLIYRKRENLIQALRICARTNYPTPHPWLVAEYLLLYVTRISNLDQVQDTEDALSSILYLAFCSPEKKQKLFTS